MNKELTPFVTPDSLRKVLQTMKNFNDTHTKKNCGYEDINGSQYVGIVNNFGSELLLETRKLLMDKPSLKNVFTNNTFDFYFDIQYSEMINTYDQQTMLVAVLSKDILLSNKEYRIKFENCDDKFVIRSESFSDPSVYREKFIHTTTTPTLVIHDLIDENAVDINIQLFLNDDTEVHTDYYFMKSILTDIYIDTYTNGTMITKPLTDNHSGLPFVWMCVDVLSLLPNVNFVNNIDYSSKPLLTIGTDGHGINRLYPAIYGNTNVPIENAPPTNKWYIKATASTISTFVNSVNTENNYKVLVEKISYVNSSAIGVTPYSNIDITYDTSNVEITLSKDVTWLFKSPIQGDYDYNGTTYINRVYAYVELTSFPQINFVDDTIKTELLSAFELKFDDKYLHKYEVQNSNAVTGIHIDASSEYSDNSISKKNGVIHDLGDFDGLPPYFKYLLPRTIHRAHVEMYSIHDDLNNPNQQITDKQVCGLILDSAIPQMEANCVTDNLNVVFKYDMTRPRTYFTNGESVSLHNSLSELTFLSRDLFGNTNILQHKNSPKFVYHGNRRFSLNVLGITDELEKARPYYVSNDEASYINNAKTDNPKPLRTLANINDIPTDFTQLMNVTGIAPTLVIDEKYIRQEANYSLYDKEMLINGKAPRLVVLNQKGRPNSLFPIYPVDFDFNSEFFDLYLTVWGYSGWGNLNASFKFNDVNNTSFFLCNAGGTGYAVNDKFSINICGVYLDGHVTEIGSGGSVTGLIMDLTTSSGYDEYINVKNLDSRATILNTSTVSGVGSGLKVRLELNSTLWNSLMYDKLPAFDDIFALKLDEFNNVWSWVYDSTLKTWSQKSQLTGLPIVYNFYDTAYSQRYRSIVNVMMYHMLLKIKTNHAQMQHNMINEIYLDENDIDKTIVASNKNPYILKSEIDITTTTNHSQLLSNFNKQDTYYVLKNDGDPENNYYTLNTFEKYPFNNDTQVHELPRHHMLNLLKYYDKSCSLSFKLNTGSNSQPTVYIYNPFKNTIEDYTHIYIDNMVIIDKREMTFADVLRTNNNLDEIITSPTGILNGNVYGYNEYCDTEYITNMKNELAVSTRQQLVEIIREHTSTSHPLKFESTEYRYTNDMLINYILNNCYDIPCYKKDGIKLLRSKGEQVLRLEEGIWYGVGKQPTGTMVNISSKKFKPKAQLNGANISTSELLIFNLPDYQSMGDLNNYRIRDEDNNDISIRVLLIYKKKKYLFRESKWVEINLL